MSSIQNPSHTYTTPGIYNVDLKITEPRGLGEEHLHNYIWVRADTLKMDSTAAEPGTEAVLNVYFRNSAQIEDLMLAFTMANTEGLTLDSTSSVGSRSATFDQVSVPVRDDAGGNYAVQLVASPLGHTKYLAPGSGTLVKLYIGIPAGATRGTVVTLDTASLGFGGSVKPVSDALWGSYWPIFKSGKIVVGRCRRGKVLCGTGIIDLNDLSALVSYLTLGTPTPDSYGGNVNGIGIIDLADLSYLISYLTGGGAPPPTN